MSMTFTKLFSSITESTIWVEDHETRIVWIAMLAMADRKGRVWGSIPGLANRARVSVDGCRKAIMTFLSPDPDSRTKEGEGRRIREIDGGWQLINYLKYREIRDQESIREQTAQRVSRHRKKKRNVTLVTLGNTNEEAEADIEAIPKKKNSDSPKAHRLLLAELPNEWAKFAKDAGMNSAQVLNTWEGFSDYWRGVPGSRGTKLDWAATWRNWIRRETKNGNHQNGNAGRLSAAERVRAANPVEPDPSKGHLF